MVYQGKDPKGITKILCPAIMSFLNLGYFEVVGVAEIVILMYLFSMRTSKLHGFWHFDGLAKMLMTYGTKDLKDPNTTQLGPLSCFSTPL